MVSHFSILNFSAFDLSFPYPLRYIPFPHPIDPQKELHLQQAELRQNEGPKLVKQNRLVKCVSPQHELPLNCVYKSSSVVSFSTK